MRRSKPKPPLVPTPRQITEVAAAIRAGWDKRELLIRSGVEPEEAAARVDGVSYCVPGVMVLEPREPAPAE